MGRVAATALGHDSGSTLSCSQREGRRRQTNNLSGNVPLPGRLCGAQASEEVPHYSEQVWASEVK